MDTDQQPVARPAVTDDEIAAAEAALDVAADQVAAAEARDLSDGDNWRNYERCRTNLRNAGERLDLLRAQRRYAQRAGEATARRNAAIEAANTAHADAEKTARKDIDALEAALTDSRNRVAKASNLAVKALMQLYAAGQAHDALVRTGAAQLLERGLPLENPDLELAWATGAAPGMIGPAVRTS